MQQRHAILTLAALAGLLSACCGWAQQCTQSSEFLELACGNEVRDDFWVEFARCRNLSGVDVVVDCWVEAAATRAEDLEGCVEIREARNEVCELLGDTAYDPLIDPAAFLSPEETAAEPHPFFPLVPGTVWIYEALEDEEIITVTVLDDTREILGVTCTSVRDVVTDLEGEPIEDTIDWFAQDRDGNVWYFGEIAQNFEDGFLTDIEGSFVAGVEGAKPGIVMPADPMPGDGYRQEYFLGDAEDAAEVLSLSGDESSEAVDCEGQCLVTRDINPLEPGTEEHKFYLAGVGVIVELNVDEGGRVELVEIIHP